MRVLAIDTSTQNLFLAVTEGKDTLLTLSVKGIKHGESLPETVKNLERYGIPLNSLELIASGIGPGSFTGTRVGLSFSLGLSFGLNIPIVGVSSLAAKAHSFPGEGTVVSAVDGRREEVFYGIYRKTGDGLEVITPEERVGYSDFKKVVPRGSTVVLDGRKSFIEHMERLGLDFITSEHLRNIAVSIATIGLERFKEVGDEKLKVRARYLRGSDPEEKLNLPL